MRVAVVARRADAMGVAAKVRAAMVRDGATITAALADRLAMAAAAMPITGSTVQWLRAVTGTRRSSAKAASAVRLLLR